MVSIGSRRILGLVLGAGAMEIAEVSPGRPVRVVRHSRFALPAELSLDKPQELGRKLAEYLRSQKYGAKHVVVGLPSRWTLLKARQLPPANATAVPAMLKLMIEREYHANAREWVFDYVTRAATSQGSAVLLGAATDSRVAQVREMLKAAGLTVAAIVPATLTAAPGLKQGDASQCVLMVGQDSMEMVVLDAGKPVAVDRLVSTPGQGELLAMEVGRVLAMHQQDGSSLAVHDGRAEAESVQLWSKRLGLPVTMVEAWSGQGNAAGAMAASWLGDRSQLLDFAHSRLADTGKRKLTRPQMLAGLAVLVVLLFIGFSAYDWYARWSDVHRMRSELDGLASQLTTAQANVDRLRLARGWYEARPDLLDTLRAITLTFPTNGQAWVTNITLRDDMTVTLTGKGQDERAAISLMEAIRASPAFDQVKLQNLNQADRTSRTVNFSITFLYTGKE